MHCKMSLLLWVPWLVAPLMAQEQGSGGIYGYTSIEYDQASNTITAYSETDVDQDQLPYYSASVACWVTDENGTYQWPISNQWSGDEASYSETLQYSNNGAQAYTAYGEHSATMVQYYYDPMWDTYDYWDPFDYLSFSSADLSDWGGLSFYGPGDGGMTESSSSSLGVTYDSDTLVVPLPCGDVRDILIQEYATFHVPFKPNCGDFMYSPWWTIMQGYYNSDELTPDQSTARPNYAVLQKYAYADGLDYMSDNLYPGSTAHFGINSGYRNPAAERDAALKNGVKPAWNSRHLAGDGVDIASPSPDYWIAVHDVGLASGACIEPRAAQGGSYTHVHADWRTQTGVANTPSGGNSFPGPAACPPAWGR